jgi:hypothetical protein
MAFPRRITTVVLVLFVALSLLGSAEASFLDTIRQKLSAFTTPVIETTTATSESVVKKPKREGKRVAIIGTSPHTLYNAETHQDKRC